MRQVFFKTTAALQVAGAAGADRFTDLGSGELGFWNIDAATGGAWFGSALFQSLVDDGGGTGVAVAKALPLFRDFQVAQGFATNNPIATPIINANNLVKVTAAGYQASARHALTMLSTADDDDNNLSIRFVIRTTPTDYISYVNNEVTIADLSGAGYQFPLGQFNTTNHKLFNLAVSPGASPTAVSANIATAIQNNNTANSLFTVVDNGAAGCVVTARHAGVVFEAILVNESDSTEADQTLTTAWDPGVGNDWQARGDELKAREYAGNFNRMYFPQTYADFVTDNSTWDRYEIVYRVDGDRDVVKGSQFASAIIYEVSSQQAVDAVLNGGVNPTAGTTTEYLF